MKISDLKQYFRLIAEEVNVKNIHIDIAKTEKGIVAINYDLNKDILQFILNGKYINSKKLNKVL